MQAARSVEVRRILDRYLVEVVEAYDLCPWARTSRLGDEVAIGILWGTPTIEAWLGCAREALARDGTRVAMIVAPELAVDPAGLRAVRDELTAKIATSGIAHFHPDAPLDLASPARLVPYVRRSPDPLLQLVPLSILHAVRTQPPTADLLQQAQLLGGRAIPPRADVAERIAATNHATVTAQSAAIAAVLDDIARDRAAAYARVGISASR